MIRVSKTLTDYELIDCGNKEKLERWKNIVLRRPDPTAIWPRNETISLWNHPDAHYHRSKAGGGSWQTIKKIPDSWQIKTNGLLFKVSPTDFKHTGLFPEQAVNWEWMNHLIQKNKDRDIKVLNLFAYTGGATLACSKAGASEVVHVDAAKHMVKWAQENAQLNQLQNNKIRFIVDDCVKFVQREIRRGRKYDAIIMDPPSYGRGPSNELWKIEEQLVNLIQLSLQLLSDQPLFFLVNSYTTALSAQTIHNIMNECVKKKLNFGVIDSSEIGLQCINSDLVLPCGVSGRWCEHERDL
ncbi:MAG: SAM-dependent methyltransferase [Erysipelothrix sp.]|nr:SAM-dependent methyltransferase [Erysipelothrix sp.]